MSSGLNSQFGYKLESTYGTGVTVDQFPRVDTFSIMRTATRVQGSGIQSGALGPLGSLYSEATSGATATVELEAQTTDCLGLWKMIMGSGTSAQQAATAAYLHTFTLADPVGLGVTVQGGRPLRGGTVVPATMTGGKVVRASFSASGTENLKASLEFDGQAWDNTTALAAASYAANNGVYTFPQLAVKMGTYASESAVNGVRGFTVDITRGMDTEAYYAGAGGVKAEPVLNELAAMSGTISADWLAKATFEDLAAGTSGTSLVLEWTGAEIESPYNHVFRITIPGATFDSESQDVAGPQELTKDWPWEWKYDGANLPKIEVINAETAI